MTSGVDLDLGDRFLNTFRVLRVAAKLEPSSLDQIQHVDLEISNLEGSSKHGDPKTTGDGPAEALLTGPRPLRARPGVPWARQNSPSTRGASQASLGAGGVPGSGARSRKKNKTHRKRPRKRVPGQGRLTTRRVPGFDALQNSPQALLGVY